jgi:acyl-coenzyme A synthetase/AMP-(fatty) acid ligase
MSLVPLLARGAGEVLFRGPGRDFTAAAFLADVAREAEALPPARHVLNLCQDRYRFAVGFAAALLRGQVSLLTSERAPERLRALAARFEDVAAITDQEGAALPVPHRRIAAEGAAAGGGFAVPEIPAGQLAAIVFTSGSTGEPVGTEKHWGTLAARSIAGGARFFAGERPVTVLGTVPPWHMYGFETTLLLPLHAACASWCAPLFYPSDVRDAAEAVPGPRVLVTTPLQLRALLQAAVALPAIAAVISATAPLDAGLAAEAEARWGTQMLEIFGATEVGSIASRRTIAGSDWTLYDGVRLEPAEDGVRVLAPPAPPGMLNDVAGAPRSPGSTACSTRSPA